MKSLFRHVFWTFLVRRRIQNTFWMFAGLNGVCHSNNVSVLPIFSADELQREKNSNCETCSSLPFGDLHWRTKLSVEIHCLRNETIFYFYLHYQLKFTFCFEHAFILKKVYTSTACIVCFSKSVLSKFQQLQTYPKSHKLDM